MISASLLRYYSVKLPTRSEDRQGLSNKTKDSGYCKKSHIIFLCRLNHDEFVDKACSRTTTDKIACSIQLMALIITGPNQATPNLHNNWCNTRLLAARIHLSPHKRFQRRRMYEKDRVVYEESRQIKKLPFSEMRGVFFYPAYPSDGLRNQIYFLLFRHWLPSESQITIRKIKTEVENRELINNASW